MSNMDIGTPVRHGDRDTCQTWKQGHLSDMETATPVRHGDGETWRGAHLSDMGIPANTCQAWTPRQTCI